MATMTARILVVDDDRKITALLRRTLAYEGYQVELASDGKQGLLTARDFPPDLVILDVMMPELDGLEVCRRLRAGSEVPILMLTARDEVPDRVAGLNAGADD
jgi:two-component system response regulator MprA